MTISGPEMHRQLMDGYKDVQRRMEDMRSQIASIDAEHGELNDERSDALVDLAKHYLPELSHQAVDASWIEARRTLSQVLMRKDDHQRRVSAALADLNDRRHLQDDRLMEIDAELDSANKTQQELSGKVEQELSSDAKFTSLTETAVKAEAALERAESNLNEIEQDAARKLPAYRESSLFQYLRKQKFGTGDYKKRGFTRRMDRFVAKLIDFHETNQGYEFLVETPDRMRKIIADDREALDVVMGELESRRDLVMNRLGLPQAIEKVDALAERREKQLVELDKLREETDQLERELTDLQDTRGSYYQEAVEAFREMLANIDTRDLASKADATPSLTDDQIVARIQGVDQQADRLDDETRNFQNKLRDMQGCVEAMGRLVQRFRASKFDADRSQFLPSINVIDDLHRVSNEKDIEDLWSRMRRAQRWGPTLGDQITGIATHPVTQVLVGAMAQAAGSAMRGHAHRAGRRRYQSPRRSFGKWSGDSSSDSYYGKKRRRR